MNIHFKTGTFSILGSRPNQSKTKELTNIAAKMAKKNVNTLIVTTIASEENIGEFLRQNDVSEDELKKVSIVEEMGLTIKKLEKLIYEHKPEFVLIESLQTMAKENGDFLLNAYDFTEVSRGMRIISRKYKVHVLSGITLNKRAEGIKPTIGNFRDSGYISQDASIVMGLFENKLELLKSKSEKKEEGHINEVNFIYSKQTEGNREKLKMK